MTDRQYPTLSTGAMSDIAFLLLIFFVTTTQILDERGIPVILPNIHAATTPIQEEQVLHIHVNAADRLLIAGQEIGVEELGTLLYKHIANPDVVQARQTVISLHCARESSYAVFISTHDVIRSTYRTIWEELAMTVFQRPYSLITDEQRQLIRSRLPLVISEADTSD